MTDAPSPIADTNSVNEAGLTPDGTEAGSDSNISSGNLLTNDQNIDATTIITQIASNENTATVAANGVLTMNTEHGTINVYTENIDGHSIGDYEYTLTEVTNGDGITDTISYTVDDGSGNPSAAELTINIVDDLPVVAAQTASIELGTLSTNLIIVADRSGSMGQDIDLEEDAIAGLVDSYLVYGDVNVNFTSFSTDATNSGWQENVDNNFTVNMKANGWTDYDDGMQLAMDSASSQPEASQTIVYFMSDGKIEGYDHTQTFWNDSNNDGLSDVLVDWKNFIETEADMLFTIDMSGNGGEDLNAVALQPDNFFGGNSSLIPSSTEKSGEVIVVEDLDDLKDTLILTVGLHGEILGGETMTGSLVTYGADGGVISQIEIGGETYSYDGTEVIDSANNIVSTTGNLEGIETEISGVAFAIDLETGTYTYSIDETVSRTEFQHEDMNVSFTDGDGDSVSTSLTFEINPSLAPPPPVAVMSSMASAEEVLDFSAIPSEPSVDNSDADSSISVNQILDTSDPLLPPAAGDSASADITTNDPATVVPATADDQSNTAVDAGNTAAMDPAPDSSSGLFSTNGFDSTDPTPIDDTNTIATPVIVDTDI